MAKYTEFNPLQAVVLHEARLESPKGLTVVVGANSSGKSLLLRDIEKRLTLFQVSPVVAVTVDVRIPRNMTLYFKELIDQGILERMPNNKLMVTYANPGRTTKAGGEIDEAPLINTAQHSEGNDTAKRVVIGALSEMWSSSLFLENRRSMHEPAPRIGAGDKATNDLQALYLNQAAQDLMEEETERVLGITVWLDSVSTSGQFILRTSPSKPDYKSRFDPVFAIRCRPVSEEGDGVKSYVAILLSVLVGKTPVRLIDEPESNLHSPQQYAIGQFIGKHGTSTHHATFVATHSSAVLRGVLDSARKNVGILRLDRQRGPFRGTMLNNEALLEVLVKPGVRAEAVLDGLFARSTIIMEGDGDRDVYSAAGEKIPQFHRDIHIVSVSGTGGIAEVPRLYSRLKIRSAVVADLDLAMDHQKLEAILQALTSKDRATALRSTDGVGS